MARQTNGLYPKAVTYSWWEQYRLTERETEVAVLLSDGVPQVEIARRLCIASRTVRFHIENIVEKIGATSTFHAAIILHRSKGVN